MTFSKELDVIKYRACAVTRIIILLKNILSARDLFSLLKGFKIHRKNIFYIV